jgi:hypothetical protein
MLLYKTNSLGYPFPSFFMNKFPFFFVKKGKSGVTAVGYAAVLFDCLTLDNNIDNNIDK